MKDFKKDKFGLKFGRLRRALLTEHGGLSSIACPARAAHSSQILAGLAREVKQNHMIDLNS